MAGKNGKSVTQSRADDGVPARFTIFGFTPICPHCTYPAKDIYTCYLTRCATELFLSCSNSRCGHRWVASLTATMTVSASKMESPKVRLCKLPRGSLSAV